MLLNKTYRIATSLFIFILCVIYTAGGNEVTVYNSSGLRTALSNARPGTRISLMPGNYGNGLWISKVSGTKENPIIISGADPRNMPLFEGGNEAIHFSDCNYLEIKSIRVARSTSNGINSDDGGSFETPSTGMVFDNIIIENIGPTGNRDALKLSGLANFVVKNCTFSGWGGSAIDMVGCRDGIIENCRFIGKEGYSQDTGIQTKGGSERITIRLNFFKNAGQRGVNIGGSTGLEFFRPELRNYEAKDIEVAGNHFVGSLAPMAYVTSINCTVRYNTIVYPDKWVTRILQEQPTDKFLPCQYGVFESNLIVYNTKVQTYVNVGSNTLPETFVFNKNAWYSVDLNRVPTLPVKETNGIYQVNPMLQNAESEDIIVGSKDPRILIVGAHAYKSMQARKTFSFQTVVRNQNNQLAINTPVGMRISILKEDVNGKIVYSETRTAKTNANGLATVSIGSKGGFEAIDWPNGSYFLKVEIDYTGGDNYTNTSVQEILAVPYALHAKTAEGFSGTVPETDTQFQNSPAMGINRSQINQWNNKQPVLKAGQGIVINGNIISVDDKYFTKDTE